MSVHCYILIGKFCFQYKALWMALTGFVLCLSDAMRASHAIGARLLLLPGDRAVSWPCRWHRAPDDDRLLYGVESVISVLTMHNGGFTVSLVLSVLKRRKWNYTWLKSLSRKGKFFNAERMASLASLKTSSVSKSVFSPYFLPISTSNDVL